MMIAVTLMYFFKLLLGITRLHIVSSILLRTYDIFRGNKIINPY